MEKENEEKQNFTYQQLRDAVAWQTNDDLLKAIEDQHPQAISNVIQYGQQLQSALMQEAIKDRNLATELITQHNRALISGEEPYTPAPLTCQKESHGTERHPLRELLPDEGFDAIPFAEENFSPKAPSLSPGECRGGGDMKECHI